MAVVSIRTLVALAAAIVLAVTSAFAADMRAPPPDLATMKGKEATAFYLGLNAVIWGYPAVKFEQLMRVRASADSLRLGNPQSAVNQLGLVRQLRGPEFKQVATPNNDTLYAQAFCDVSREPLVVSVPKIDGNRYYGLQLWDPNGDTFAYIGSRTTGREAGDYALVGPDWMGTLPPGVKRIDSPYNGLAIWGRIGVDGPGDLDNALAIQDQLRLTPLSQYGKSDKQVPPDLAFSEARLADPNPQHVTGELEFFVELANSLKHTPPKAQDAVVAESSQPDRLQGWQHDLRRRLAQRAGEGRAHQGGAIRAVHHGRLRPDRRRAGQRLAVEPEVRDHGQRLPVPRDVRQMVHRRQCARRSDLPRRPHRRSWAPARRRQEISDPL